MSSIKSSDLQKFLINKGLIEEGASPTITPLSGGFWNDVYRVQTTSKHLAQDWIVKSMQENNDRTRLYPNQPRQEMEALKLLAPYDITATFVGYHPAEKDSKAIVIYDYAPGTMLTEELNKRDRKTILYSVAELFAKQHSISSNSQIFRQLPQSPKTMIALAEDLLQDIEPDKNVNRLRKFQTVLTVATWAMPKVDEQEMQAKPVFLHTDAWAGNFILDRSQQQLKLIDWQCPAIGDASFDIWTFAFSGYNLLEGKRPFNPEEKSYFVDSYTKLSGDDGFEERFKYFENYYAYQIAAHACQRIVALAVKHPQASLAYQQVFELQINLLEKNLQDLGAN